MYRDNNNFLKYNTVLNNYRRFWILKEPKFTDFFNFQINNAWETNTPLIRTQNVTYTGLQEDSIMVTKSYLFSSYFFLSDIRVHHTRNVFNFAKLMGLFGGMFSTCYFIIHLLGLYMNNKIFLGGWWVKCLCLSLLNLNKTTTINNYLPLTINVLTISSQK